MAAVTTVQEMQTFLQVQYCDYAEMLQLNILLFEKHQQVLQHGDVVRSQQQDHLIWVDSVKTHR